MGTATWTVKGTCGALWTTVVVFVGCVWMATGTKLSVGAVSI